MLKKRIRFNVDLTVQQLLHLGVHVGHTVKNSKNLASWMYYGLRKDYVIINLSKTYLAFKKLEWVIENCISAGGKVLFVELDRNFMMYIARYALISGETFVIYRWIAGVYTNTENVLDSFYNLYLFFLKRQYLTNKEKIKLKSFIGLLYSRFNPPGLTFFSRVKSSRVAVLEMFMSIGVTAGIVDTDISTWEVGIPIPGNDDSLICINFYAFFVSNLILLNKIKIIRKWKKRIRVVKRVEYVYFNWIQLILKKNKGDILLDWNKDLLKFLLKEYYQGRSKNVITEVNKELVRIGIDLFGILNK